jgi:tetratricopeptide (TPR) repeat protein
MNRWVMAAVAAGVAGALAGGIWLAFREPERFQASAAVDLAPAHNAYRQGDFEESAAMYEEAAASPSSSGEAWFFAGLSRHMMGEYEPAIQHFEKAEEAGARASVARYNIACALAMLGRRDEALASLEKAFALGYRSQAQYASDPDLLSLRDEPRFKALMEKMASPLLEDMNAMVVVDLEGVWETNPGDEGSRLTIRPLLQGYTVQFTLSDLVGGVTEGMMFYRPADKTWSAEAISQTGIHTEWTGKLTNAKQLKLELTGDSTSPTGEKQRDRMIFSPQGKDRLRIEQSQDRGEGWKPTLSLDLVRSGG